MCSTYHNEEDEINPVPKGMCVLDIVHDISPGLQADDEKDSDPRQPDVVKRDRPLERVLVASVAQRVVPVPVDALAVVGQRGPVVPQRPVALDALGRRVRLQVVAPVHAAVLGQRADVVLLHVVVRARVVVRWQGPGTSPSTNYSSPCFIFLIPWEIRSNICSMGMSINDQQAFWTTYITHTQFVLPANIKQHKYVQPKLFSSELSAVLIKKKDP